MKIKRRLSWRPTADMAQASLSSASRSHHPLSASRREREDVGQQRYYTLIIGNPLKYLWLIIEAGSYIYCVEQIASYRRYLQYTQRGYCMTTGVEFSAILLARWAVAVGSIGGFRMTGQTRGVDFDCRERGSIFSILPISLDYNRSVIKVVANASRSSSPDPYRCLRTRRSVGEGSISIALVKLHRE